VDEVKPRCAVAAHVLRHVFPPCESTCEITICATCPSTSANFPHLQSPKGKEAATGLDVTETLLCWPLAPSSKGSRAANPSLSAPTSSHVQTHTNAPARTCTPALSFRPRYPATSRHVPTHLRVPARRRSPAKTKK
jgi:hypothetical protein